MSRRKFIRESAVLGATVMSIPSSILSKGSIHHHTAGDIEILNRFIAVDNVCAWPNLTQLKDGSIVASIFNQPSHGRGEGDVDCWSSKDGRFWNKVGTAALHEHMRNRMNVAAGLAKDGDLIVIASGWSLKAAADAGGSPSLVDVLRPVVSRSSDGGHTWLVNRDGFPEREKDMTELIPFGDIILAEEAIMKLRFMRSRMGLGSPQTEGGKLDKGWTFLEAKMMVGHGF
ncbi:MAG: hypothetical protein IPL46_25645 [Saprospiraceae bacterium]|nr:hypothetical protein [Saprospiraceae bacterium]